jgi:nucleotide-binding universal stress UspA family protein
MYRTILLCYDGSEEGRNALREGADTALCMGAQTHLLAILREPAPTLVPEGFSPGYFEDAQRTAQRLLDEGVDWLRARNLQAQGQLVFGNPVRHIADCASALGADLIVLSHRRRGRLARWWSDAEGATLLELAPCSILVAMSAAAAPDRDGRA